MLRDQFSKLGCEYHVPQSWFSMCVDKSASIILSNKKLSIATYYHILKGTT